MTPGLIITQHTGEGKANQYFLRGYNLDHGTDLAITVDGMPINMRTHAHGQGYADLNFLIPELIGTVDVRKGPYFADEGDFSSVGAVHVNLLDSLHKSDRPGTRSAASATSASSAWARSRIGDGTLLYAGEVATYNGPWTNPDDMRKFNGVCATARAPTTTASRVTGMAYNNRWNSTDQVPLRAITSGEIGLYGALDPTDGGNSQPFLAVRPLGADRRNRRLARQRLCRSAARSICSTTSPTSSPIRTTATSSTSSTTAC